MDIEELWKEVLSSLSKAGSSEECLQIGVNIIMHYLENENSEGLLIGMEDFNLRISLEPKEITENSVSITKH